MLILDQVHAGYNSSEVLHGIDLQLQEGEVVTLLGRNGMGKTTTIRSTIGFTPPRRGAQDDDRRRGCAPLLRARARIRRVGAHPPGV